VSKFASFINADEKFSIKSDVLPVLNEGEVLVKNLCTSICRSDIHTYQGKRIEKSPTILGHEIVGIIEQLGPHSPLQDLRGNELKIGDKLLGLFMQVLQMIHFQKLLFHKRQRIYLNMGMSK